MGKPVTYSLFTLDTSGVESSVVPDLRTLQECALIMNERLHLKEHVGSAWFAKTSDDRRFDAVGELPQDLYDMEDLWEESAGEG